MSLARTALRIAAIESLSPSANVSSGPWPTAAGPHVYGSHIDPINAAKSGEELTAAIAALQNRPIVSIYTEEDHSQPYGSEKVWPHEQVVTLLAVIIIAQIGQIQIQTPDGPQLVGTVEAGPVDEDRECLLDAIGSQIRRTFDLSSTEASITAPLLGMVAMECHEILDDPQRDAHGSARLALRTVKFNIKVKKESWPALGATVPSGIAGLPCPLRNVAKCLPPSSAAYARCLSIASWLAAPPALPPKVAVAISMALDRSPQTSPPTIDEKAAVGNIGESF